MSIIIEMTSEEPPALRAEGSIWDHKEQRTWKKGIVSRRDASNMGGNKGFVPVPHFGPNTSYANFAAIRAKVDDAMATHHVPEDDGWCLARTGRAPAFNHIDGHNMLFPRDPDS